MGDLHPLWHLMETIYLWQPEAAPKKQKKIENFRIANMLQDVWGVYIIAPQTLESLLATISSMSILILKTTSTFKGLSKLFQEHQNNPLFVNTDNRTSLLILSIPCNLQSTYEWMHQLGLWSFLDMSTKINWGFIIAPMQQQ